MATAYISQLNCTIDAKCPHCLTINSFKFDEFPGPTVVRCDTDNGCGRYYVIIPNISTQIKTYKLKEWILDEWGEEDGENMSDNE